MLETKHKYDEDDQGTLPGAAFVLGVVVSLVSMSAAIGWLIYTCVG